MIARYDTECAVCDGSIRPGDEIVRDADGDWIHASIDECDAELRADAAGRREGPPPVVCQFCYLLRPCDCPQALQHPEDAADAALRRAKENAARDPWEGF